MKLEIEMRPVAAGGNIDCEYLFRMRSYVFLVLQDSVSILSAFVAADFLDRVFTLGELMISTEELVTGRNRDISFCYYAFLIGRGKLMIEVDGDDLEYWQEIIKGLMINIRNFATPIISRAANES